MTGIERRPVPGRPGSLEPLASQFGDHRPAQAAGRLGVEPASRPEKTDRVSETLPGRSDDDDDVCTARLGRARLGEIEREPRQRTLQAVVGGADAGHPCELRGRKQKSPVEAAGEVEIGVGQRHTGPMAA